MCNALTHRSALVRLGTAGAVGVGAFVIAWSLSYALLPEGATRFTLGLAPELDARAHAAGVATTLFLWHAAFGFGVIALAGLFSIRPISLAHLAPSTWLAPFRVAPGPARFPPVLPRGRSPPP